MMEREETTRLSRITHNLKVKLDLFVRFMRSKWMAYLFLVCYITMLLTLLVMVFIIIRYSFNTPGDQPEEEDHSENLKAKISVDNLGYIPGLVCVLSVVLFVFGYVHYRWTVFYHSSRHLEYQQI